MEEQNIKGGQVIWSSTGNQSKIRGNKMKEKKLGESLLKEHKWYV